MDTTLRASARWCMQVFSESTWLSSFARTQGIFSSTYLLARLTRTHTSSSALLKENLSICALTLSAASRAIFSKSASNSSLLAAAGITPPQYFSIIETVLETRFPKSFAKSQFIRFNIISFVNIPSCPNVYSLRRKYFSASIPYLSISITGSTTLPFDLLILPPSIKSHPCPRTCFGSGSSIDISIAGQMMLWNLTISLPTR